MLIDHVNIPVSDLAASEAFYTRLFQAMGAPYKISDGDAIGFGKTNWEFGIVAEIGAFPKLHLAFRAVSPAAVGDFYEAALQAGGKDNGAPGLRPYHPHYYAAYILDPDGHNIEAVYRGA